MQRSESLSAPTGISKKKYKMLKAAFKEEREARVTLEFEFNKMMTKLASVTAEFEETKDKNLQLYEKNMQLEETVAEFKTRVKVNEASGKESEHMKEMLGTQNLLREEMKEKEFFKN
jgi:hypothetical protein